MSGVRVRRVGVDDAHIGHEVLRAPVRVDATAVLAVLLASLHLLSARAEQRRGRAAKRELSLNLAAESCVDACLESNELVARARRAGVRDDLGTALSCVLAALVLLLAQLHLRRAVARELLWHIAAVLVVRVDLVASAALKIAALVERVQQIGVRAGRAGRLQIALRAECNVLASVLSNLARLNLLGATASSGVVEALAACSKAALVEGAHRRARVDR